VREIFEKEVPQSSIRQVAKKYGIHYVTLSNRARKIFS
jgi:DNA invertase Pin-like site-specific DNA recombinase